MKLCNERLYGVNGLVAVCQITYGTEHSHHDYTAEEAVKLSLAKLEGHPPA